MIGARGAIDAKGGATPSAPAHKAAEPIIITARVAEFCRMSGISERQVHRMIKSGELKSVKIGTLRLINVEAYRRRVSE